jgi:hypothetical protein
VDPFSGIQSVHGVGWNREEPLDLGTFKGGYESISSMPGPTQKTARVDANREFFDNFEAIVEDDASWAYRFQREYNRKPRAQTRCPH